MNRMSNFTYLGKRNNEAFYQNQAIVIVGIVDNDYT